MHTAVVAPRPRGAREASRLPSTAGGVPRIRSLLTVSAAVTVILSAGTVGLGQITFDQDFDGGSLKVSDTTVDYSNPTSPLVTLVPRSTWDATWHEQDRVFFKAGGVNGLTPRFELPLSGDSQMAIAHQHLYSYDQVNWTFFDNNAQIRTPWKHTFSNNTPFTQDEVHIAYALPYPTWMTAQHTASVKSSPWVSPTLSADANLVVGRTLGTAGGGYTTELGRSIPALDMFGYKVTDPAGTGPKAKIVLTAGNHAEETVTHYAMQGLVDFVISGDPRAAMIRRFSELYVYPQNNPEGRWAGYKRTNPENPNSPDHNRWWHDPAGFTDITIYQNAMKADTGGHVEYFFDFHTMGSPDYSDLWPFPGQTNSPFVLALKELEPGLRTTQEWEQVGSATTWAKYPSGLGADYAYTAEFGSMNGALQDRYYEFGMNYALALYAVITPEIMGDVDGSGYVDDVDLSWLLSSWDENVGWNGGNLNNDGIVDDDDLSLLLANWNQGVPPGAPGDAIPEPATIVLLAIGAAAIIRRGRS